MTDIEMMIATLKRDIDFIKATLGDFTDAEMLVRPVEGANHAAWQIGHLVVAESRLINAAQAGAVPAAPPQFIEKFKKETAKENDPAFFPKKAELLDALIKGREATVAWVKTLTPADLDKTIPPPTDRFAATIGLLIHMLPLHATMHLGQFQVIRRKLGKPVLM